MIRVAIIIGSTRPGRKADAVARWVHEIANERGDAEFELVDVQDFKRPPGSSVTAAPAECER
jgi:NAD(P)H-dependent FMN reductase